MKDKQRETVPLNYKEGEQRTPAAWDFLHQGKLNFMQFTSFTFECIVFNDWIFTQGESSHRYNSNFNPEAHDQ